MRGALALRVPCGSAAALDTSGTSVTNAAYVQLQAAASMTAACSAIVISNSGAQPLTLASGGAGSEVDLGIVIPPLSEGLVIPLVLKKTTRMSVKSLGGTQSSGFVSIMYLQ